MKWKTPPRIKVLEALGAVSDGRVDVKGNAAEVFSSSRRKSYTVSFDPQKRAIMMNDNGSYWKGYLGYPGIAFLMITGLIPYRSDIAEALRGIPWKDINTELKNDFTKTEEYIDHLLSIKGFSKEEVDAEMNSILSVITSLALVHLGKKTLPPKGY